MKRILLMLVLGATLLLSACGGKMEMPAATEEHVDGTSVEAHDFWARSAMKDGNGAAYMLLHNHSAEVDVLIGASSEVAGVVELHLSQMKADGTMEMIKQDAITLPADGEVELKPGSYHIMLIGLKQDLKAGDEFSLTLHFKNHADITLTIPVMDAEGMGGAGMDGHSMNMGGDAASLVSIEGAWGRPSPKIATAGAFYMMLKNSGSEADKLTAASSEACGTMELHESYMDTNGAMAMRPVEGGFIEVPAGGMAELKPGGLHIMCIDKKDDFFAVGSKIDVTLQFEKAGEMPATVEIHDMSYTGGSSMNMGNPTVSIEGAWGRPSPKIATAGAFYMMLKNSGSEADKLTAASSEACGTMELHESYMDTNGAMAMRPVEGGFIEVPAGGMAELKPGGLHIMCIDKKDEFFTVGSKIDVTLQFEKAGEMPATVEIHDMSYTGGSSMNMGNPTVSIEGAWGRPSPKIATAGAFYMMLKNSGSEADKLTAASSEACGTMELHESYMDTNGAMAMRPVEGGFIEVPAGGMAELKPGGLHIMCIDKKDEFFTVGSKIDVALQFEKAGEMPITVEIHEMNYTGGSSMNMEATPTP